MKWTWHPMFSPLAPLELKIAGGIAEGLSNKEISRRVFATEQTVSAATAHIYSKLGLTRGRFNPRVRLANLVIRAELVCQSARFE